MLVRDKGKGRILKRREQENKTLKIFRKTNISYPLTRTRTSSSFTSRPNYLFQPMLPTCL